MELAPILITALSAPLVTVCAPLPWPWVLAVSLLSAAVVTGLFFLRRGAGTQTLPHLTRQVWGRIGAAVLLGLTALFLLLLLWRFLHAADTAFPESDTLPFVPLTLLAVAAWSGWHGRAASLRAVRVLFLFLAGMYGAVFLFALPDVQLSRLRTWPEPASLTPLAVLLLPALGLFLTGEEKQRRLPGQWLLLYLVFPTAAAALCAAIPGSRGSFYEMAKSIEVFSVAQRLEPLVSALLTMGWFGSILLLALCAGEMAQALGISARYAAVGFCVLGVPGCLWDLRLSDGLLAAAGAVFCVLLPALTLVLGVRKKPEKT